MASQVLEILQKDIDKNVHLRNIVYKQPELALEVKKETPANSNTPQPNAVANNKNIPLSALQKAAGHGI